MQYNDEWQVLIALFQSAFNDNKAEQLFRLIFTEDERQVLPTRVQIIKYLLEGKINQRELKDRLGIGIATVTRGSNSLKEATPEFRTWLSAQLLAQTESEAD